MGHGTTRDRIGQRIERERNNRKQNRTKNRMGQGTTGDRIGQRIEWDREEQETE